MLNWTFRLLEVDNKATLCVYHPDSVVYQTQFPVDELTDQQLITLTLSEGVPLTDAQELQMATMCNIDDLPVEFVCTILATEHFKDFEEHLLDKVTYFPTALAFPGKFASHVDAKSDISQHYYYVSNVTTWGNVVALRVCYKTFNVYEKVLALPGALTHSPWRGETVSFPPDPYPEKKL